MCWVDREKILLFHGYRLLHRKWQHLWTCFSTFCLVLQYVCYCVTCGFTANLQLFSWFYSKFVAVLPVVSQQVCDCFPDFTANLLLCYLWFYSKSATVFLVLQKICYCVTCGFTANLWLFPRFYSKFVTVWPVVLQQICCCVTCDFTANLWVFLILQQICFCLFPPGGHAVERPRISSTVVPEAAGESSEASETSARQPARLTTSLLLCLSQGIFLITVSASLCAFCCTTIVDMVVFLYSVVGVDYERNSAGFTQWLVLSMKETLHVPGVLLPKSHIAAFINVLIENNVARLYGIDFNPYQPVFKFNQFVHVIERSRKKDTLFDCPVRL